MIVDDLKDYFDQRYKNQNGHVAIRRECSHPTNRDEAAILAMKQRFREATILEIGAGDGSLGASLLAAGVEFQAYDVTDFSETRCRRASQQISDGRFRAWPVDVENAEV